ncbi:2-amino-4-hydroxy-6-hydroxymethyldihydropteridine diphosphokinase [Salinisphaera aquimarina]|uniref:2-amino-4-hydroxy-6-hydroxymethyldihydropteridine pyrophosphokinase n=1 Tax=Salinisphaera aquimarina TaxID=2094031 RepID=A0ABV7EKX1_9GAMM
MNAAQSPSVFVGLGSNIQPHAHIPLALDLLEKSFGTLCVSPIYQCPAVGFDGADFVNLVVGFDNDAEVHALQSELRDIEAACGRDRSEKYASRTMDIDLLLYGDKIIDDQALCLPRADILEYAFVLRPLAELVPEARHPVSGETYADLWRAFDARDQPLTEIALHRDVRLTL